ncbi:MAG: hypothetical protein AAB486_03895 [Patescibacteria group bacterium]
MTTLSEAGHPTDECGVRKTDTYPTEEELRRLGDEWWDIGQEVFSGGPLALGNYPEAWW